jgi:Double zinc ribbon
LRCPRCQHENREGRRFCSKCGAELAAAACPRCGFTNEPGDEFCGGCGARLGTPQPIEAKVTSPAAYTPKHLAEKILTSKAALEGERKQVTVLFADLKGSMELVADRDPEEARKFLDPVLERMMEAVHHYEGTVKSSQVARSGTGHSSPTPSRVLASMENEVRARGSPHVTERRCGRLAGGEALSRSSRKFLTASSSPSTSATTPWREFQTDPVSA